MDVALNDRSAVIREYASPEGLAARGSIYAGAEGRDAKDVVLETVAEADPVDPILDVGCGPGDFADRLRTELRLRVVAADLSPEMVRRTRSRGVEAIVADVQNLPFADASFGCVVANWMLYHVPDVDRALAEVRRVLKPGGCLVATTKSERHLGELWKLAGHPGNALLPFRTENARPRLGRYFGSVRERRVEGTVELDYAAAYAYLDAAMVWGDAAARLPRFEGTVRAMRLVSIFVCRRAGTSDALEEPSV